jgi:hypothetical protein
VVLAVENLRLVWLLERLQRFGEQDRMQRRHLAVGTSILRSTGKAPVRVISAVGA